MNHYIAMILRDKERTTKDMEVVIAPYKKKLEDADKALAALGYNPNSKHVSVVLFAENPAIQDNPTIKQRVTSALTEQYPNGAHYSDILDYINSKWPHLSVKRTSLSPQLTRLRKNGVIDLDEEQEKWHLMPQKNTPPARGGVYDNSDLVQVSENNGSSLS